MRTHARLGLVLVLVIGLLFGAIGSATAQTNPTQDIPVTGTFPGGGTFTGTLDITGFRVVGGQLVAVGELSGTLTNAAGQTVGTISDLVVQLPVTLQQGATCEILHLELGPLDLDLLGLVVHLDQVVLDITAEQGPGNLLGNLLCAIAGLLDNPGGNALLRSIAQLLNQILAILG
jgi:hypothetical protein